MPRRSTADNEDTLHTCPRCQGVGEVWDAQVAANVECPICRGEGRISERRWRKYIDAMRRP